MRPASHVLNSALALVLAISVITAASMSASAEIAAHDGWVVTPTPHDYASLVARIDKTAAANKIGVVTRASATLGAKKVLNKTIPGNMVIGLYHPRFAVRMLEASVAAGIEAPIRLYVTENPNGTATLSYKMPSLVFAPYMAEGGEPLKALAAELDDIFAKVVSDAAAK